MNKYMIGYWDDDTGWSKKVLLRYRSIKKHTNPHSDKKITGVTVVDPKKEDIKEIIFKKNVWSFKTSSNKNFWIPFCIEEDDILFEAPDDDSAKLIFEVGER